MDASFLAGRSLFASPPGHEISAGDERALRDLAPSGYILFARHLKSVSQTRDLVAGLREIGSHSIVLSIDQEGGAVNRLTSLDTRFLRLPPARLQAGLPEDRLRELWMHVGSALAALGVDLDFAPVVDLDGSEGSNAIGPRSFSTDPGEASACARHVVEGLAAAGVASCLKHFPGLGGTTTDTHQGDALSELGEREIFETHVRPYDELAAAADAVMPSHARYVGALGEDAGPATFTRTILRGWLRERVGFGGLIVTDDLGMGAVSRAAHAGELAVRALDAGADVALFCDALDAPRHARDTVADAIERGRLDADERRASVARVDELLKTRPGGRQGLDAEAFELAAGMIAERA